MRLIAQVVTMILVSGPIYAQQPAPAALADRPSSAQDGTKDRQTNDDGRGNLDLPVSLDKIREALAQPPPPEPLKGPERSARLPRRIRERQRFELLMDKVTFEGSGPVVAGGRDAYDQYQRLFPRIDNPRLQPYGAFSTGEILTLGVEALVAKYVAQKMAHVFGDVLRAQAEREAREEVARSLAGFWAAQPGGQAPEPKP